MWPLDNLKQETIDAQQTLAKCPRCGATTKTTNGLLYPKIQCQKCGLLLILSTGKNEILLTFAPFALLFAFLLGGALL